MIGMVLAAGLGTRLRPLTNTLPKPAVPVANRPLASFAVEHLLRAGASEVRINAYHLADRLVDTLRAYHGPGVPLRFHIETTLLGTGGGLRAALADVDADLVVVMNGDILFAPDLDAAIATHRASNALATLIVRRHENARSFGAVEVDATGRIARIAGAPDAPSTGLDPYVFTGVHVLSRSLLRELPHEGCIVRQCYQGLLARGARLTAHVDDSAWFDLGTPGAYLEANLALATGALRFPGVDRSSDGIVAPSAIVEGTIVGSVVGPGAHVTARASIESAVVWGQTRVDHPVHRAIVTPDAILDVP